jgi:TPP-dependent pyruvate/acetoin dehydrogenase alpha subunit
MATQPPQIDPRQLLEQMMLIRAYEEALIAGSVTGKIPGTCTSVGQEAAAVGVVNALTAADLILTNHRSAGHLLARGADPGRLLAEVMGRSDGYCKGKSGSLHISAKELGVVLTSTIVGAELSLAPGVALSQTMLGGRASSSASSAMVPPARAASTSHSTSPRCGSCLSSMSARTTSGRPSSIDARR